VVPPLSEATTNGAPVADAPTARRPLPPPRPAPVDQSRLENTSREGRDGVAVRFALEEEAS
jgi:hypothetical protein